MMRRSVGSPTGRGRGKLLVRLASLGTPCPYGRDKGCHMEDDVSRPPLVVVLGPTASGKSALGIALAQRWHGEIVSADSRQVYCGLDIGTAKVTPAERALVPHHLLDVVGPTQTYTVAQFQHDATAAIDDIVRRGKLPLLVGGSPHYIQAVVDALDIPAIAPQPELRQRLEQLPLSELLAQLEQLDPQSAATIDRHNPRRVIRALEVCLVSGRPFSEQRGKAAPRYRSLLLGISWPREQLYQRIDQRVDERMQQGMVNEVRSLLRAGVSYERLDALGLEYRFISRLLRGEFSREAEMVTRLKYAIHDFTRRQLSWFRRDTRIVWIAGGGQMEQQANEIVEEFLQKDT
jgi:tRNA dimethylallyltransferase